jgi:hypothetical protein
MKKCKSASNIYQFQHLFLLVYMKINTKKQGGNNFSWSILTLFTGKYGTLDNSYHRLFRACCHETAVRMDRGVAAIPDCRLSFGFPPDGSRGTGQRDSICSVATPVVNETKPIVAGIQDFKHEPKPLGVKDAMGC